MKCNTRGMPGNGCSGNPNPCCIHCRRRMPCIHGRRSRPPFRCRRASRSRKDQPSPNCSTKWHSTTRMNLMKNWTNCLRDSAPPRARFQEFGHTQPSYSIQRATPKTWIWNACSVSIPRRATWQDQKWPTTRAPPPFGPAHGKSRACLVSDTGVDD
jgi:hypothetical protein